MLVLIVKNLKLRG